MRYPRISTLILVLAIAPHVIAAEEIVIKDALVIRLPRQFQRSILAIDPVEALMAAGKWKAPRPGESVVFSNGQAAKWEKIAADANGWFSVAGNAYVFAQVKSASERVAILNGLGDAYAYINGELRLGAKYAVKDTYESWEPHFDYGQVPILLKKGENDLLFRSNRGRLKVVLSNPSAAFILNDRDTTLPDLLTGEPIEAWGAIVVMNATARIEKNLAIMASSEGWESPATDVGVVQPLSVRKAAFLLKGPALHEPGRISVSLTLFNREVKRQTALSRTTIELECKSPLQNHKRTFRSAVDGSIQYYSVNPAQNTDPDFKPALVLSVHGAGVEAVNQAASYECKSWANILVPTNRRPYGFDWEDWGRLDALEAMRDFAALHPVDPERVYLTGHSMGGHGAWILGVTFPDKFAAIGPSAGWISFRTYASRQRDEGQTDLEKVISRPLVQGDPLALIQNTKQFGVYILHGEKDESVAVSQSRQMAKALAEFHKDFVYHEEKDAPHWWDKSEEPGTDCVDWAPMFDFFARRARPRNEEVRELEFATANPGVSAECHWARIEAQTRALEPSSINLRLDPGLKCFSGTTQNVARLALDLSVLGQPDRVGLQIDGQSLEVRGVTGTLWLFKKDGIWSAGEPPSPSLKGPSRNGLFKDAFRNRMIFVYGTRGTSEETSWAFEKARFDAECFQYQGNGSIDILADRDFDPGLDPDRNVILYGNTSTNGAWRALLRDGPVEVNRAEIVIGGKKIEGKDLACLFIRPRPASDVASVGVVAGTGIVGMRLTNTRPYFSSGYALPDLVVYDAEVVKGSGKGIRAAGFFGMDWGVESGEFVWAQERRPAPPTHASASKM